jgi:hypothetical protein
MPPRSKRASARAKRARHVLDRLLRLLLLLVDRDQALRPRVQHAALVEVLPQLPGGFDQARRNDRVSGNRFSSAVRSGFRADGLVARFQRYFLTRTEAAGSHLPWSLRLRLRLRLRFDFRLLRHAAERRQVLRLYSDREHRTLRWSGRQRCCPCCSAPPPLMICLRPSSSLKPLQRRVRTRCRRSPRSRSPLATWNGPVIHPNLNLNLSWSPSTWSLSLSLFSPRVRVPPRHASGERARERDGGEGGASRSGQLPAAAPDLRCPCANRIASHPAQPRSASARARR